VQHHHRRYRRSPLRGYTTEPTTCSYRVRAPVMKVSRRPERTLNDAPARVLNRSSARRAPTVSNPLTPASAPLLSEPMVAIVALVAAAPGRLAATDRRARRRPRRARRQMAPLPRRRPATALCWGASARADHPQRRKLAADRRCEPRSAGMAERDRAWCQPRDALPPMPLCGAIAIRTRLVVCGVGRRR
jgi:hypothetical protein